jgi:hypothetical protein
LIARNLPTRKGGLRIECWRNSRFGSLAVSNRRIANGAQRAAVCGRKRPVYVPGEILRTQLHSRINSATGGRLESHLFFPPGRAAAQENAGPRLRRSGKHFYNERGLTNARSKSAEYGGSGVGGRLFPQRGTRLLVPRAIRALANAQLPSMSSLCPECGRL